MRVQLGIGAGAIAALALSPLAVIAPVQAAPAAAGQALMGNADPGFSPSARQAAITAATADKETTKRELRLGAKEALVVQDVSRDTDGVEHIRYQRTYAGMPVIGGDLVVHEDAKGAIASVDYASRDRIAVASTAPSARVQMPAGARKVVFAAHTKPVLAWETTATGTEKDGTPIRDLVYTDAKTGKRLAVRPQIFNDTGTGSSLYSGSVSLTTTRSGTPWVLTDSARGNHSTYDANNSTSTARGTLFSDTDNLWGTGTTSSRQSAAVDAAYGAAQTWDYFKNTFGRNGIANNGVAAYSRVHYGSSYENAFWDDSCFCMTYGDGGSTLKPLVSLDVAGHEMTHGVTSATAGLDYSGDSGGLNEATSDVFGTMVEFNANNASDPGDYYVGEKIMQDGTYLRRMDKPSLDGGSVDCWTTSTKNLDVHYSSGVGNHMFYLLAEGTGAKTIGGRAHSATTCNGTTLAGIGRASAAAIWYRAMTTYWISTTTYPQAANGQVKAAKDLYGATSSQCTATLNAWKGVNVAVTETCGTVTPPAGGNLLLNPGFESGAASWTASSGVITNAAGQSAHAGSYFAWLDGYGSAHTDTLSQTITIPAAASASLTFYVHIDTAETGSTAYDTLTVAATTSGVTTTKATYSNANAAAGYVLKTIDMTAYVGKTVTVKFTGTEDSSLQTSFVIDDVSVTTP